MSVPQGGAKKPLANSTSNRGGKAIVSAVQEFTMVPETRRRPLELAEAEIIRSALLRHHGNRDRTAAELGISRTTLWRKMKRFGI